VLGSEILGGTRKKDGKKGKKSIKSAVGKPSLNLLERKGKKGGNRKGAKGQGGAARRKT